MKRIIELKNKIKNMKSGEPIYTNPINNNKKLKLVPYIENKQEKIALEVNGRQSNKAILKLSSNEALIKLKSGDRIKINNSNKNIIKIPIWAAESLKEEFQRLKDKS